MGTTGKPLVWLRGEIKTPPFTPAARLELEVFAKSSRQTPDRIIQDCRRRLRMYDDSK